MFTIKIQWGLGNQMFQYAMIKSLSLKHKKDFSLDISEYKTYFRPFELELFNIEKQYTYKKDIPFYERLKSKNRYLSFLYGKWKKLCSIINPNHYIEKSLGFDKNILQQPTQYFEWYFQNEQYFSNYEDEIRNAFQFKENANDKNTKIIKKMQLKNSVSIHIRRWDYISNKSAAQFHELCGIDFYQRAIHYIKERVESPVFFLFSDDIEWVKENLGLNEESYYIDWNTWKNSHEDMRLMSNCKHNIIANSSFSWWWAWLNPNKNKIIVAPKNWLKDKKINAEHSLPSSWIRL